MLLAVGVAQEVRSWTGWHRHVTLVLAAQAFLSVLRYRVEPLPGLSIPPFFLAPIGTGSLVAFKVARGLSSGSVLPNSVDGSGGCYSPALGL